MAMLGKPYKRSSHLGIDIFKREVGNLRPQNFVNRAMEDQILHLGIDKRLRTRARHDFVINNLSFNVEGSLLLSQLPNKFYRILILWDWERGNIKLSFDTGHSDQVAHALFMSGTNSRNIVTCGISGTLRYAQLHEDGSVSTQFLAEHRGRVHQLAVDPGNSNIFYTSGEGVVHHFDIRAKSSAQIIQCRSLKYGSSPRMAGTSMMLNTIAVDPVGSSFVAVAGDDEYVRVYDIRRCGSNGLDDRSSPINFFCPRHMIGNPDVWVTGLAFSDTSEILASYGNESIYLFTQDLGLGVDPIDTRDHVGLKTDLISTSKAANDSKENPRLRVYKGLNNEDVLRRVRFLGPDCQYVVSGSNCGNLFIWRKRDGELMRVMKGDKGPVFCVEPHPRELLIASSGINTDIKIWTPYSKELNPLSENEQVVEENLHYHDNGFLWEEEEHDNDYDSGGGDDEDGGGDDEDDYDGTLGDDNINEEYDDPEEEEMMDCNYSGSDDDDHMT